MKKEDRRLSNEKRERLIMSYKDLEVYQLAYKLAMEIFFITKSFLKEERYFLTGQILESLRSVAANIAEGYSKRRYENIFKRHLNDALGSCDETKVWLDFSVDCEYIAKDKHNELISKYSKLGAKIYRLMENWKTYV